MSAYREGPDGEAGYPGSASHASRPSASDGDFKVNATGSGHTSQTSRQPGPSSPLMGHNDVKFLDLTRPQDKGNVVYFICTLWGIGVLLPWNSILSTFDFFGAEVSSSSLMTVTPDGRLQACLRLPVRCQRVLVRDLSAECDLRR